MIKQIKRLISSIFSPKDIIFHGEDGGECGFPHGCGPCCDDRDQND